ncbi:MAG: S8 family serine peptidase [Gammaproteobacteria bacterium]|nr:S8 family serine peptidase [Gammaproteobacteria bacterium]
MTNENRKTSLVPARAGLYFRSLVLLGGWFAGLSAAAGPDANTNKLIVKFKSADKSVSTLSRFSNTGVSESKKLLLSNRQIYAMDLQLGADVDATLDSLSSNPDVEYAEIDHPIYINATPNDPSYINQWGLFNNGQNGGVAGIDIGAEIAWSRRTDTRNIVIGVIDSGVDYNHPDIRPNVWTNPAEASGRTGIDDDGNGYIDDIHGIDTINGDSNPMDDNGHGTHVAGVIAAAGNDGFGIAGVAWKASMVICKALDNRGEGNTSYAIECLEYFAKLKQAGVNIVVTNNSYGGQISSALAEAIQDQEYQDILFVAAAGNDGEEVAPGANSYNRQYYPAALSNPNIISVASLNRFGELAETSNYGAITVDMAAPGDEVYSTLPNQSYGVLSGTSMAAPHVTGAVALMRAENPYTPGSKVKQLLLSSIRPLNTLTGKVSTGGMLKLVFDQDTNGEPVNGDVLSRFITRKATRGFAIGNDNKLLLPVNQIVDATPLPDVLKAVDYDGQQAWEYTLGYSDNGNPEFIGWAPIVSTDGFIYFMSSNNLRKLAPDGSLLWRETLQGGDCNPADRLYFGAVASDGGVVTACDNEGIVAYDRNGQFKWQFRRDAKSNTQLNPTSTVTVDVQGNVYYTSQNRLVSLNRFGRLNWFKELEAYELSWPVLIKDRIYISSSASDSGLPISNNLFAFDLTGKPIWSRKLNAVPISGPVIDEAGNLIVAARNSTFVKLNPAGTVVWSKQHGDSDASYRHGFATVLKDGNILSYVERLEEGTRRYLVAIDGRNGAVLWEALVGTPIGSPMVVPGQNRILSLAYIGSDTISAYLKYAGASIAESAWPSAAANDRMSFNVMRDLDQDGMDDDWEALNGLSAASASDGLLDSDVDGISNLDEFGYGSNPHKSDSDGDGLSDREEVTNAKTDPGLRDTDGDGLSDFDEVMTYQTNPFEPDTDADGLPDRDEVLVHLTNPLSGDTDGDEYSDLEEINELKTNPLVADPKMADLEISMSGTRTDKSLKFTVDLWNLGPRAADAVVLDVNIPASVGQFTSIGTTAGCGIIDPQHIVCQFAALQADRIVKLAVTANLIAADENFRPVTISKVTSMTVDRNTLNNEASLKSGCFIATAAFGHIDNKYVKILRDFRDQYLLTNEPGKAFVETYYRFSPAIADWISQREAAKAVVRIALVPLIAFAWVLQAELLIQVSILSLACIMFSLLRRRARFFHGLAFS